MNLELGVACSLAAAPKLTCDESIPSCKSVDCEGTRQCGS